MAIYQFYLAVVPKSGFLLANGNMSEKISVSTQTGFFESKTEVYWNLANIDPGEIMEEIDKIITRASGGNNPNGFRWKIETIECDNDASIELNDATGKIEEFIFRADLREDKLVFLIDMIELGKKYEWIFMDRQGNLANPDFEEIKQLISISNAYRFLKNPYEFLSGLGRGEIHVE